MNLTGAADFRATTYALRGAEIAMYDENNVPGPEYRVRTVPRYIVTRYCHPFTHSDPTMMGMSGGSTLVGEFQNEQQAFEVAQALAKAEAYFGATVST